MTPAAISPAIRPTLSRPSRYTTGTVAAPSSTEGSRIHTVGSPSLAVIQASRKNSGGEFSPPACTVLRTAPKLRPAMS